MLDAFLTLILKVLTSPALFALTLVGGVTLVPRWQSPAPALGARSQSQAGLGAAVAACAPAQGRKRETGLGGQQGN